MSNGEHTTDQYPYPICVMHEGIIKEIATDIKMMKDRENSIYIAIFGNGKTGLLTRVAIMENEIKNIQELRTDVKALTKTVWIAVGIAIVLEPIVMKLISSITI